MAGGESERRARTQEDPTISETAAAVNIDALDKHAALDQTGDRHKCQSPAIMGLVAAGA
jgi:hypothetical protein